MINNMKIEFWMIMRNWYLRQAKIARRIANKVEGEVIRLCNKANKCVDQISVIDPDLGRIIK